jgi:CHAT domain-containing protein
MTAPPDAVVHLHRLLGFADDTIAPVALSAPVLQALKPRAEQLARARSPAASEIAELLVELAERTADLASLALACWISGNVYHNLGLMKQAHAAYQRADSLYTQLDDPLSAARMSVGWVHVLGELGDGEAALTCAQRAEATLLSLGDQTDAPRLAHLYGNRGIVHEHMGHLVAALADYERKVAFFQSLPNRSSEVLMDEALALNDVGVIHALLGQYNTAERIFQQALSHLTAAAETPYADADRTLLLMNVAWLKVLRHSPPGSVRRAFQQARSSRDLLADPESHLYFAFIDLDEANYLLRSGRWQEVNRTELAQLWAQLVEQRAEFEAAYAALLLGQIDFHAGQPEAALARFEEVAADAMEKAPTLAYLSRLWQARALRARGDLVGTEQSLHAAVRLIEETRRHLTVDDYRAGYLEDKLVAYHDLIDLYLVQRRFDRALALAEHSKARTLAETISGAVPAFVGDVDKMANADSWKAESSAAAEIGRRLPDDMLAVSFVEMHDRVWTFLVDAAGMVAEPIELGARLNRADLENGLRKIQRIAHAPELAPAVVEQQTALAQEALSAWYVAYLAPLQPWLERYARLLISPDGWMNALPFACLYDAASRRYLCETHAITMTPSLALWPVYAHTMRSDASAADRTALVVGASFRAGVQGALPATVTEAQTVAGLFAASTLLTEQAATMANFLHTASQAHLIYIAAHGEHHLADPSASFIELADGPLRVRDILGLRLDRPVVVLNACDTHRGYLLGNEMMGLVRSFFYAGASAVIATQWQVEDAAAADLMTQIMREMQTEPLLARAVQRAQQRFIRRSQHPTTHPFFWGAVVITDAGRQ